jgi:hypothetical protein
VSDILSVFPFFSSSVSFRLANVALFLRFEIFFGGFRVTVACPTHSVSGDVCCLRIIPAAPGGLGVYVHVPVAGFGGYRMGGNMLALHPSLRKGLVFSDSRSMFRFFHLWGGVLKALECWARQ